MKKLLLNVVLASTISISSLMASRFPDLCEPSELSQVTRTTVVGFDQGWHVSNMQTHPLVRSMLGSLADYELGKGRVKPDSTQSFTLEEAQNCLRAPLCTLLQERGISEEGQEELLTKILSPAYFSMQHLENHDLFLNGEEASFKLLSSSCYLDSVLFNTIVADKNGNKSMQIPNYRARIDPRIFLIPAKTVQKWFYTHTPSFLKKTFEEYARLSQEDESQFRPHIFKEYFDFPETEGEKEAYYLTHPISFLSQELMGNILNAARRIAIKATSEDRIVIFGNTPYFVGRALEALYKQDPSHAAQLIFLPFSGAPNTLTARNAFSASEDIVTPERHRHHMTYLKSKGLLEPSLLFGTTYLVDVIGSGSGPAYVMGNILESFSKEEKAPNFHVICLNEFTEKESRNVAIASSFAKDGESLTLSFPSKGSPFFHTPASVVYVKGHGDLDMMPDTCPALRIVPKYNPVFWNDLYNGMLEAPLTHTAQLLCDHFDVNIRHLLNEK